MGERVYSITFDHNGEEWTATVGKILKGLSRKTIRVKGEYQTRERVEHLSDPALVLAIFPGVPYVVITNHKLASLSVGSEWENPFFARPRVVARFSSAGSPRRRSTD
jgi:hypothetical protein